MDGAARRFGSRGGGGMSRAGGAVDPYVYSVNGLATSTNYLATAAAGGVRGSASGYWVGILFTIDANGAGVRYLTTCGQLNTNGWQMWMTGTETIRSSHVDGVGSGQATTASGALSVGSTVVHGALHYYDTTVARLFVDRAATGAGAAATGYTAPDAGLGHTVGVAHDFTAGNPDISVIGVVGGDGYPASDAQVLQWFDGCKNARDVVPPPWAAPDNGWSVRPNVAVPSSYSDRYGSSALAVTGTLAAAKGIKTWAW